MASLAKQISIFIENKPGRIAAISRCLREVGIRIYAMMIADVGEFGVLNLVVDDNEKAKRRLIEDHFTISETDVTIFKRDLSRPEDIASVAEKLGNEGINVQYAYGFATGETYLVLKTSDVTRTQRVLEEFG